MNVAEKIIQKLAKASQKLSTAESCTGGLVGASITAISGSSAIYEGGIISYSNAIKEQILKVNHQTLEKFGAVSENTAREMAFGVQQLLGSTWGISTTGIAGPTGGSEEKPVGIVCFGLSGPIGLRSTTKNFGSDLSRDDIRKSATEFALTWLMEHIPIIPLKTEI